MSSKLTKVVHIKDGYDVYIGRPGKFGNPYSVEKYGRATCIARFGVWFMDKLEQDLEFRQAVLNLKGKRLGCYCKPLACHGDIIAEYLNGIPDTN